MKTKRNKIEKGDTMIYEEKRFMAVSEIEKECCTEGYTANMLRKEFESLRRELPTLWTRSFYVESVGHISEQTIIKYIENQKNI